MAQTRRLWKTFLHPRSRIAWDSLTFQAQQRMLWNYAWREGRRLISGQECHINGTAPEVKLMFLQALMLLVARDGAEALRAARREFPALLAAPRVDDVLFEARATPPLATNKAAAA